MAGFQHLCQQRPELNFDDYWKDDNKTELIHFIGKDIIYFHALFWPAILHGSHHRLPSKLHVHGFLTLNGQKMSKSRGTYITARDYLSALKPDYLRYYFAAKLNAQVEDIDLNTEDFATRINADLVGKYINLASRCAGFISKKFQGRLANQLPDPELYHAFVIAGDKIADYFTNLEYNQGTRLIMALADRANQYIDEQKPWVLAKQPDQQHKVQLICTQGLNLFRLLTLYLAPILPETADNVAKFLNHPIIWQTRSQPLCDHDILPFKPLMQRIEVIAEHTTGLPLRMVSR